MDTSSSSVSAFAPLFGRKISEPATPFSGLKSPLQPMNDMMLHTLPHWKHLASSPAMMSSLLASATIAPSNSVVPSPFAPSVGTAAIAAAIQQQQQNYHHHSSSDSNCPKTTNLPRKRKLSMSSSDGGCASVSGANAGNSGMGTDLGSAKVAKLFTMDAHWPDFLLTTGSLLGMSMTTQHHPPALLPAMSTPPKKRPLPLEYSHLKQTLSIPLPRAPPPPPAAVPSETATTTTTIATTTSAGGVPPLGSSANSRSRFYGESFHVSREVRLRDNGVGGSMLTKRIDVLNVSDFIDAAQWTHSCLGLFYICEVTPRTEESANDSQSTATRTSTATGQQSCVLKLYDRERDETVDLLLPSNMTPIFTLEHGWCSCNPPLTKSHLQLNCTPLQRGMTCLCIVKAATTAAAAAASAASAANSQ